MGFSKDVKLEILNSDFSDKQKSLAFLCGLIYSSAEYEVNDNKVEHLFISTDLVELFDCLKNILQDVYNNNNISLVESFKISTTQYYQIVFNDDALAEKVLLDTKSLEKTGEYYSLNTSIAQEIISSEISLQGFISGAYIGCGTSSIKLNQTERTSTGYHLELSSQNYDLLYEISTILAQFDILAKQTERKNINVLYIKDAEAVSNMLALMGASNAVLLLQNEIITRQMRNKINRQNNCYTSNYNKTLNASFAQLDAIRIIEKTVGLNSLDEDLMQVALLRLANTEESLDELLKLSKMPLTKSALNYKFQKLIKLSQKLEGKK